MNEIKEVVTALELTGAISILKKVTDINGIADKLYRNQPDCFQAIAKERRAEASFDIATVIQQYLLGKEVT